MWAGRVDQVIEHLPSKREVLSSDIQYQKRIECGISSDFSH
jgi:hypothetical protein